MYLPLNYSWHVSSSHHMMWCDTVGAKKNNIVCNTACIWKYYQLQLISKPWTLRGSRNRTLDMHTPFESPTTLLVLLMGIPAQNIQGIGTNIFQHAKKVIWKHEKLGANIGALTNEWHQITITDAVHYVVSPSNDRLIAG